MAGEAPPQQPGEVGNDRDVDGDPTRLQEGRLAHKLVHLDRNEQRGRNHGEVLGPEPVEPKADALDELEQAVAGRRDPGDEQRARVQAVKLGDNPVQERALRVELDRAHRMIGDPAEVAPEVSNEVGAGGEQQQAAGRSLERDQAQDAAAAWGVSRRGHRPNDRSNDARAQVHWSGEPCRLGPGRGFRHHRPVGGRRRRPLLTRYEARGEPKLRVVILSAEVGEGHAAAARALAAELVGERADVEVLIGDALVGLGRVLRFVLLDAYRWQLRFAPWIFGLLYCLFARVPPLRGLGRAGLALFGARPLLRLINRYRPDIIVSTYRQ